MTASLKEISQGREEEVSLGEATSILKEEAGVPSYHEEMGHDTDNRKYFTDKSVTLINEEIHEKTKSAHEWYGMTLISRFPALQKQNNRTHHYILI